MSSIAEATVSAQAAVDKVEVSTEYLTVLLADGRRVSVPLAWYPRLLHGTMRELANYELSGGGYGIHWPDLDEDINVDNILEGRRSQEGPESFARWQRLRNG